MIIISSIIFQCIYFEVFYINTFENLNNLIQIQIYLKKNEVSNFINFHSVFIKWFVKFKLRFLNYYRVIF